MQYHLTFLTLCVQVCIKLFFWFAISIITTGLYFCKRANDL